LKVLNTELKYSPGMKILLVEDDEFCAYTVMRILKNEFDIVHKFSGNEGVEEARLNDYDLLLLDIGLKDINGVEVLKQIKNIPSYKDIPSIAVTAYAMSGDKERFLKNGFDYYISKPYSIKELKELIYKAIKSCVKCNTIHHFKNPQ
jgi:CheY-like chemotaxis protein